LKAKGVFLPLEDSLGARARCGSVFGPVWRPAVPSGARGGAAGRAHADGVEEKGVKGKGMGADKAAPPVSERKLNEEGTWWVGPRCFAVCWADGVRWANGPSEEAVGPAGG
jgi:hypothetical protein